MRWRGSLGTGDLLRWSLHVHVRLRVDSQRSTTHLVVIFFILLLVFVPPVYYRLDATHFLSAM
jgi:hypothetical protein